MSKQTKGDPLVQSKKFQKKSHSAEKKWGYGGILSVISRFWTSVLFLLFVLDALFRFDLLRFEVVEVWRCWTNEQKSGPYASKNKPGTAQVGAISRGQKQLKDFKVSKYSLLRYRKNPKVEPNWRTRGDTLRFFIHSVANHQKIGGHFWWKKNFLKKSLTMPKKLKGGTIWDFSTSVLSENSKKIEGGTLWGKFFPKKKSQSRKYSKGVPFEFLRWCKNTTSQAFAPVF